MSEITSIDQLVLAPSARWMAERIARVIDPSGTAIQLPAAWCIHQLQQGHTCLDFDLPVRAQRRGTQGRDEGDSVCAMLPTEWLRDLAAHAQVQTSEVGSRDETHQLLALEGRKIFLAQCRHAEIQIANKLRAMAQSRCAWASDALVQGPTAAEQAVAAVRRNQLTIITGGPGTGKTTIASKMIDAILRDHAVEIALLASTGKAAKRLENSTHDAAAREKSLSPRTRSVLADIAATTIHAALRARGEHALAHKRVVVVDECSMIDLNLMYELLERLHPDATLILLGDAHQLASVEAGSVLTDILPRDDDAAHPLAHCTVRLSENFRFPADGEVAQVATAVNDGAWDRVRALLASDSAQSVRWKIVQDSSAVVEACYAAFKSAPQSRVLCGHRRGPDGSLAINRTLAKRIAHVANPDAQDGDDFDGRPIIVTVNDPVTGLRNGDTGIVQCTSDGQFVVKIDGYDTPFPLEQIPNHEAAYALTIHKSQGSEYKQVIVVLPAHPSPVVTRELLYTAITRTQGEVLFIATEASLQAAVEQRIQRASGLRDRMVSRGEPSRA